MEPILPLGPLRFTKSSAASGIFSGVVGRPSEPSSLQAGTPRNMASLAVQNGVKTLQTGLTSTLWRTSTLVGCYYRECSCTCSSALLDGAASGSRFSVLATPSLAHLSRGAAEDIEHPTKPNKTLWDATKDRGVLLGNHTDSETLANFEAEEAELAASSLGVGLLGSGSDFTVFVQRNGVRYQYPLSAPYIHPTLHRSLPPMADFLPHFKTLCITITRSSTLTDGKTCMATLASCAIRRSPSTWAFKLSASPMLSSSQSTPPITPSS